MRSRVIASIVLAATVILGTSACNLLAPQTTTKHYDASDGVSGDVGDLAIRNAFVVADEEGTTGNLIMTVVNNGNDHELDIQWGEGDERVTRSVLVKAGQTMIFTVPGEDPAEDSETTVTAPDPFTIDNLNARPGELTTIFFQYGKETGIELEVPVLNGEMESYSTLVPTIVPAETTTPEPTDTPAPTPTPTPTAAP